MAVSNVTEPDSTVPQMLFREGDKFFVNQAKHDYFLLVWWASIFKTSCGYSYDLDIVILQ